MIASRSPLQNLSEDNSFYVDRQLLKDQVIHLLHAAIISGRILPGSKVTERDVAELLNISRMPARDALMALEHEGLVENRPNGRFVIDPDEHDIWNLFQVRMVLEKLAVEHAAINCTEKGRASLESGLERMKRAIEANDREEYIASDLDGHYLIWQQADNPYLIKMLSMIIGPFRIFLASHTEYQENWAETLQLHQNLVQNICAGDVEASKKSIEEHLHRSFELSQKTYSSKSRVDT